MFDIQERRKELFLTNNETWESLELWVDGYYTDELLLKVFRKVREDADEDAKNPSIRIPELTEDWEHGRA